MGGSGKDGGVTAIILDSIADGVFTVDHAWRITSFNRSAEEITGVLRNEAIGQPCRDVLRAEVCEKNCLLKHTMETGKPIVNRTLHIINAQGLRIPVSISTAILRDEEGTILGAVETFRDVSREEKLRRRLEKRYSFEDMVSRNHRMHEIFSLLPDIAGSDSTVLLQGESGTGKELVARALHNLSPRRTRPFLAINCAALPDTLLEAELFGYKAGAFTDAKRDKAGRFQLAGRGTLFLDEIGDISPALQVRLLRVLQEKVYEPLGGVEGRRLDARIVAATNRDLYALVRKGTFREDLYYRVNVIKLDMPPLRERMEDIPLLADHFIRLFNALQKKSIAGLSDEALACLMAYAYPGNIRELENIIERAFILCKSGVIEMRHLPEFLWIRPDRDEPIPSPAQSFREMEAAFLIHALRRNGGNRAKTAGELGMHKSTLFRKIRSLRIEAPSSRRTRS